MRHSGGIMLRSVARCLSLHRPTPSPVLLQPCPGILPSSRPHDIVPQHTSSSSSGFRDPSTCGGGADDFQGATATTTTTTAAKFPVQKQSSVRLKENLLSTSLHQQQQQQQQRRGFLSVGDGDEESDLSRHHEESLVIGYSPEQLYAVVAAVDLYEDFVPWCQSSKVLWQKGDDSLEAELEIGFKFFVERYVSHVELKKPNLVKTTVSQSKLFDYLTNVWEFRPGPTPHSTNLHFLVEFQFRSPLYRKVANMFFNEVAQRLVSSFESRCRTVYGPSKQVKARNHQVHTKTPE